MVFAEVLESSDLSNSTFRSGTDELDYDSWICSGQMSESVIYIEEFSEFCGGISITLSELDARDYLVYKDYELFLSFLGALMNLLSSDGILKTSGVLKP